MQIIENTELQSTIASLHGQSKAKYDNTTGQNNIEMHIEGYGDPKVTSQNVDGPGERSIDEPSVLQENNSQGNPKVGNETSILQSQVLQQVFIILLFL